MDHFDSLKAFRQYKDAVDKLDGILYKDIFFNGLCIKMLGIFFMDHGTEWSVKKHRHSFYECHYVTEGCTLININDVEYEVKAGQFYVLQPGTYHSHRQSEGTSHIGFVFRWEALKNNFNNMNIQYSYSTGELADSFVNIPHGIIEDNGELVCNMLEVMKLAQSGSTVPLLQIAYLKLVMNLASTYHVAVKEGTLKNQKFIDNSIVSIAMGIIEENYNQDIDVNDIANSVHLSYSHLSRLFKKYLGEPVNQYINTVRIRKAQYLLKCSDTDIGIIAAEVGFQSEHYFSNVFKKVNGISPGSYRKANKRLAE